MVALIKREVVTEKACINRVEDTPLRGWSAGFVSQFSLKLRSNCVTPTENKKQAFLYPTRGSLSHTHWCLGAGHYHKRIEAR
jgi:hypothetical protein